MCCIVCDKVLKAHEKEECTSCKSMLDEKFRGDSEKRKFANSYFKWLKKKGDEN